MFPQYLGSPPSPSNQTNLVAANNSIQAVMTTAVDQYHEEKELGGFQLLLEYGLTL